MKIKYISGLEYFLTTLVLFCIFYTKLKKPLFYPKVSAGLSHINTMPPETGLP